MEEELKEGELKKKLKKISKGIYDLPKEGDMNVPGRIFVSEKLLDTVDEKSIEQVKNVATLPGIYGYSMAMPDAHMGYGFSIGGVAAFDAEKGCISPGGVGFDINCGVRLLSTDLDKKEVYPKIKDLLNELFNRVPSGVGHSGKINLSHEELDKVLKEGAEWAVKNGYGNEEDIKHAEENGRMNEADPNLISPTAKKRGKSQLGTLGAGNHFLEVQFVDKIFDKEIASVFGIKKEGQVMIMIHCGSRGLGHQTCTDYLRKIDQRYPQQKQKLADRELVYAPAQSELSKEYYKAMCASANFAWANRHIIAHNVRQSFKKVFGTNEKDIHTVYDIAHNMAKLEEHLIEGKKTKVYVHRKGATRSFPAGRKEIPEDYRKVGQPVMIPGSMGTASYVLVGTEDAISLSFGSTAHGAGRLLSRTKANTLYKAEAVKSDLEAHKIYIKSASYKGISEEAPGAYKDVDEIVKTSDLVGLGKLVARLRPIGVVKG